MVERGDLLHIYTSHVQKCERVKMKKHKDAYETYDKRDQNNKNKHVKGQPTARVANGFQ